MEQTISNQEQRLQMLNRKKIELTGVMEVISFDTQEVVLDTVEGQLRLEGEDLHVKKLVLERGEVEIQGKVRELAYKEPKIKSTSGGRSGRIVLRLWNGLCGMILRPYVWIRGKIGKKGKKKAKKP